MKVSLYLIIFGVVMASGIVLVAADNGGVSSGEPIHSISTVTQTITQ